MMETLAHILSGVLIASGAFFYLVGAIGIYRMPDVFTRMHAAGISDTVGAGLMIAGMIVAAGFSLVSAKLAIIMSVILFTSPVATHALAQAAMHANVRPLLSSAATVKRPARKPARMARKSASPARKPAKSARKSSTSGKTAKRPAAAKRPARSNASRRRRVRAKGRAR